MRLIYPFPIRPLVDALGGQITLALEEAQLRESLLARAELEYAADALLERRHDLSDVFSKIRGPLYKLKTNRQSPDNVLEQVAKIEAILDTSTQRYEHFTSLLSRRLTHEPSDLKQIVEGLVGEWNREPVRHVHVMFRPECEELLIRGQREYIRRSVLHLVRNANDAHAAQVIIRMRVGENKRWVELLVANTGSRISEEVRRNIFKHRLDSQKPQGGGWGCLLVRSYIEAMHGVVELLEPKYEMRVAQELGIPSHRLGAVFGIWFPIAGADQARRA